MGRKAGLKWVGVAGMFLVVLALGTPSESLAQAVTTAQCLNCHSNWLDNNPSRSDVRGGNALYDYLPLNLAAPIGRNPFYKIAEGYFGSIHSTPAFDPTATDFVSCVGCHVGVRETHGGVGSLPDSQTCLNCHAPPFFGPPEEFLSTGHANPNNLPGRFFDQIRNKGRAVGFLPTGEAVSLLKANRRPVKAAQRIDECSVCHNYALQHQQYAKRIRRGTMPEPQVGCAACHQAHIPGPAGNQLAVVDSTVSVAAVAGTTVTSVTPVEGRSVPYPNHRPFKLDDTGAQNVSSGTWTRGSSIARPTTPIVSGVGTFGNHAGIADMLTFPGGGFLGKVKHGDTILVWGQATGQAALPSNALNPGAPIEVRATLDTAGFEVEEVLDDSTVLITPRTDSAALGPLGSDHIAVVAKASVSYRRATPPGGNGTQTVFVPFNGPFNFEIRDMRTSTENLCSSCHSQGSHKFTAMGRKADGTIVDMSRTHNSDIMAQYRNSGHGDRNALPFLEFSAFEYGSTHQPTYPVDMSITGSGGVGSLRNKAATTFELTVTPDANNAFLVAANNTTQPVFFNNYTCNQCHHGLGSIDYQKDRQGTPEAQVLWGDATVTCITCHEPHKDQNGTGRGLRMPVKLSFNSRFVDATLNPRGGIDMFMDGTPIPAAVGDGKLCLLCHQGRESGLTVFKAIQAANPALDPYQNPSTTINAANGVSFTNPHYLDGGAILWSKNAWEYFFGGAPQSYSEGNLAHQTLNCMGCHMDTPSSDNLTGGHTWKARVETCQQCHGPVNDFKAIEASADYDGNGVVGTIFEELGDIVAIPPGTNPVTDDMGGTGLFGQMNRALARSAPAPIFYNPNSYPYFFTGAGAQFRAFSTDTLSAAFNLAYAFKAGNAVYAHNANYIVQVLHDSLTALGSPPPAAAVRPLGDRTATDYRTIVVNPAP